MEPLPQLPRTGGIVLDARGDGRALRVSWHHEVGLVVLSLWRDKECVGTFRLAAEEVPDLVAALVAGLADSYAAARLDGPATAAPAC